MTSNYPRFSVIVKPIFLSFCLLILLKGTSFSQNQALQMDDVDDYVELSQWATDLIFDSPATIEFWFKANFDHKTDYPPTEAEMGYSFIWSAGVDQPTIADNFQVRYGPVFGNMFMQNERLSVVKVLPGTDNYTSMGQVDAGTYTNQWHHYALVADGALWLVYINGILQSVDYIVPPGHENFKGEYGEGLTELFARIGLNGTGNSGWLNGSIDEFRLWNTARTATQIADNYDKTFNCPRPGLMAYYKFDGLEDLGQGNTGINDIRDFSGNGYHGDVIGGATTTVDAPGLTTISGNYALGFDGIDDYVQLPAAEYFDGDFTIEAWVKYEDFNYFSRIIECASSSSTNVVQLFNQLNNGKIGLGIETAGSYSDVFADVPIPLNQWTQVSATLSGNTASIYYDGVYVGGGNLPIPTNAIRDFSNLGKSENNAGEELFAGEIDELRLWDYARTESEIQSGMNQELSGNESGLYAYWNFNEGCGDILNDLTSNANHGTLVNSPTWVLSDIFQSETCPNSPPPNTCYNLSPPPQAWWPAENNPNDIEGNNNGTLVNGTSYASGKASQAFDLDGLDDYVDIGDLAFLENAEAISVSAWVYKVDNANSNMGFVGKWNTNSSPDNSFLLYDGEVTFPAKGGFGVQYNDNSNNVIIGTNEISTGEWMHLVGVWRNTDGFIGLYKNGVLETSMIGNGVGKTLKYHTDYTAKIGTWGIVGGQSYKFDGKIDEVQIFNRALTDCEIEGIYLSGTAGVCLQCPPGVSDMDDDGVCGDVDCDDNDPNITYQPGHACDDGDNTTLNDIIDVNCVCVGTPTACTGIGDDDGDGTCADVDCDDNDPFASTLDCNGVCGGVAVDNDGDGVCSNVDCNDNDPAITDLFTATFSELIPFDGAVDLDNTNLFSWAPVAGATSYDLYVWLSSGNKPPIPSVSNIFGINETYTIPNAQYGQTYSWQLVAKNGTCSGESDVQLFFLRNLPDLTVDSIQVAPFGFSGEPVNVSWTVKNIGTGYTGFNTSWRDEVYFSDDEFFNPGLDIFIGDFNNFSALFPGESYSDTISFTIPIGLSGNYHIFVRTNKWDFPLESDYGNNIVASDSVMQIQLSPHSDLRIVEASSNPSALLSGQPFSLNWEVTNQGIGETNVNYWEDRVFLTQDTFDFSDAIQVAAKAYTGVLEVGDTIAMSAVAHTFPLDISGDYFLVFETDLSNNVWEFVHEDNNRRIIPISISLTPPPDLVVSSVIAPDTLQYGSYAYYEYTVKNIGVGPMHDNARNAIKLADNPDTLLSGASLIASHIQPLLAQGDSTVYAEAVYIPFDLQPNTYYNYIHTDFQEKIFEHSAENNNIGMAPTTSVLIAPDLVVENVNAPTTVQPGVSFNVTWTIRNIGDGKIFGGNNTEQIYFSDSPNAISGGAFLGNVTKPLTIDPDGTIDQSTFVKVPCGLPPGDYYIIITEDVYGWIYETDESNNQGTSMGIIQITMSECPKHDLAVTEIIAPDTLDICSPFNVQWTVANQTNLPISFSCQDEIWLSQDNQLDAGDFELDYNLSQHHDLPGGGSYTDNLNIKLTDSSLEGDYFILVKFGCAAGINDTFPDNDYNVYPVYINPANPPDLVVSNISSPNSSNSGQTISINYSVTNNGPGPTIAGSWTDKFYLSTDQSLNTNINGDVFLGLQVRSGNLQAGETYSNAIDLEVPISVTTGNYYIIATTDFENNSCEFTNENNNSSTAYIYMVQPPPSDLVVVNITNPVTGDAGQFINVSWTVRNTGVNSAYGQMREAVYLSNDPIWDASDALFGNHFKNLNLLPNQDTTFSLTARIEGVALGDYYVIVRTDILDNINEINDQNNTSSGVQLLSVNVPELPVGVPTDDQLLNNTPIYYRIEIPQNLVGETMLVSITSPDSIAAANQLYLKYGKLPTFNDFDFIYSNPLFGNQLIIIPSLDSGTVYLLAYGITEAGFQDVTLEARILPFGIHSINANKGGDNGFVTAEIWGAKFTPDMEVSLQNGTTTIHADTVIFVNAAKVFARLDLNGQPLDLYDVVATKSTNETVTLMDGFEIIPGGPVDIAVSILGPPSVVVNSFTPVDGPVTIVLQFKNNSTIDIPIPTVPVQSIGGTPMALSSNELAITGGQLELQVPLIELNGPPGILRAGAEGSIQLFTNTTAPLVFMAVVP